MKQINDSKGRAWNISVNVGTLGRVRDLAGVNLAEEIGEGRTDIVDKLATDALLFGRVLFGLVASQAEERDVDEMSFAEGLTGGVLELATQAFLEELVDFFPERRRRVLRAALAKREKMEDRIVSTIERRIGDPKLDERIDGYLRKEEEKLDRSLDELFQGEPSGGRSGSSPASSE
jgi:hypothetical protein